MDSRKKEETENRTKQVNDERLCNRVKFQDREEPLLGGECHQCAVPMYAVCVEQEEHQVLQHGCLCCRGEERRQECGVDTDVVS